MAIDKRKVVIWSTIIAAGAASTVAGLYIYKQAKKIEEEYEIAYNRMVFQSAGPREILFDLYMDFTNKSSLGVTLSKQQYDIYANDIYIGTISNTEPNEIKPNSTSTIGIRIRIDTKDLISKLGTNAIDLIKKADQIKIKMVMKYKVRLLFFNIPIPSFEYTDTLKNYIRYMKG